MAEKVLSIPLSGLEVKTAILDKIGDALNRDCYLNNNAAFSHFDAHVKIELRLHDVGRVDEVNVDSKASAGEKSDNEFLEKAEAEFDIGPQAPNEVREETGQPIPVETKDTEGRSVIKTVKYPKRSARTRA